MGSVVSFVSAPGGVGKTTLSLVSSWLMRRDGLRVLLVDMDPTMGLSLWIMDEDRIVSLDWKGRTLASLLEAFLRGEKVDVRDAVAEVKFKDVELDLVIPGDRLADVVESIRYGTSAMLDWHEALDWCLLRSGARDAYDVVVIDTIPFYDPKYTVVAIQASDRCVVPVRPTRLCVHRTLRMLRRLPRIMKREEELYEMMGVIFNMVDERSHLKRLSEYRGMLSHVSERLKVFDSYVKKAVALSRIGTEEEAAGSRSDVKRVEEVIRKFYGEFKGWLGF